MSKYVDYEHYEAICKPPRALGLLQYQQQLFAF